MAGVTRSWGLWRKGIAAWRDGYTLYLSVPFTWLVQEARLFALNRGWKDGRVVAGGPGIRLLHPDGCDWAETPETVPFDTLSLHNPLATVTTRGCPNACPYCAVPRLEGEFRELDTWKPAPIVCDNNLLAASRRHFSRVVESLAPFEWVDFNQGLDAALFSRWHAEELARLRHPFIRFSLDSDAEADTVARAIETARGAGLRHFGVYVMVGWNDTPASARARLELVRSWNVRPNPMRYQPLDTVSKNSYVAPGWTARELFNMVHYYSCLRWVDHIPFEEFSQRDRSQMVLIPEPGHAEVGGAW